MCVIDTRINWLRNFMKKLCELEHFAGNIWTMFGYWLDKKFVTISINRLSF
jgi:hypothetical protein